MFVFLVVKVQNFVRVTEDEGEKIIAYYLICPCCIVGWRVAWPGRKHCSVFIPAMEIFAYWIFFVYFFYLQSITILKYREQRITL